MARSQQMFTQPGQMYAPDTQRRMALAQALRAQGLQTPQGTSMGSGTMQRFAAPHWTQYVANLAQGLSGAYMEHQAEQTNQDRMSEFVQALRGTDSPQYVMEPGYEQPSQMDRLAALEDNPFAQQALMNLSTQSAAPQYRTLSPEEAAQMGLPEGVWQMSPEGQIEPAYEVEGPDMTSAMQEYEYARSQGFPGSFMEYQTQRSEAGRDNITMNYNTGELSPGWKAVDEDFAKNVYSPFKLGGTAADARKNIEQLRMAQQALDQSEDLTGPVVGSMPDFAMNFANPEAVNVREAVEEVVQRNLREVLGAQFTEKEGERLISRAYNPRLPQEINKERLARLTRQMEQAYQAKVEAINYFDQNGTIRGFEGNLPSIDDFDNLMDQMDREHGVANAGDDADSLLEKYAPQ